MTEPRDNWGEYSKLVLAQLEMLAKGVHGLQTQISNIEREIAEIKVRENKVESLEAWKDKIDEIASPSQLKEALDKVKELEQFKIKAYTIFTVVQFGWGILFVLLKDMI
jgi:phage shock protein A